MATSMQLVDTRTPYVGANGGIQAAKYVFSWEEVASFNHARRAFEVFRIENRVNVFGGISESNDIDVPVTSWLRDVRSSQQ
jgi:hypothetical protein